MNKRKLVKKNNKEAKKVYLYSTKEGGNNTDCFGCGKTKCC